MLPGTTEFEGEVSLSTVKHTPIVTDAHGYCNVPEPKGEMNPSTVKHTSVVTDAHKGELSPTLGSSVPPPLPKCDHPKPSTTDRSISTTTLEGQEVTKILKGEVFQPPSHPPPLPPPYRPSSPLSPPIPAFPPHRTSPPPPPPQMSPNDKFKAFQLSQVGPPSFPDLLPMSESSVPPPLPIMKTQLSQLTDRSTSTSTSKGKVTKS